LGLLKPGLVFTENRVENTKGALQVLANKIWYYVYVVCTCMCVCGGGNKMALLDSRLDSDLLRLRFDLSTAGDLHIAAVCVHVYSSQ